MLGGDVSFSFYDRDTEFYGGIHQQGYEIRMNPSVGYFPADKLSVGLKATLSSGGARFPNDQAYDGTFNKSTMFDLGPFVRYYFLPTEKNVNLFSEVMYQYGYFKGISSNINGRNTFTLSAGPVVYFNSSVGMEFLVSYSNARFIGYEGKINTLMTGVGFKIHLD